MIDDYLQDVVGIIHVGAHTGEEISLYGARNVLWIEPDEDNYKLLQANLNLYGSDAQIAVNYLVTDIDDKEYDFHVSNNGGCSSSIYDFNLRNSVDDWNDVRMTRVIKMFSITLDTLIKQEKIDVHLYDSLVLDTQGSELDVLKGCTEILEHIRYIKVEVGDFEAYYGGCLLQDIEAFMHAHMFSEHARLEIAHTSNGKGHYYDIVYKSDK